MLPWYKSSGEPDEPTPLLIFDCLMKPIQCKTALILPSWLASHSSLGDQNDCCAEYENRTNDVEHCCADAAGGRKLCACLINYNYRTCRKLFDRNGYSWTVFCLLSYNVSVFVKIGCCGSSCFTGCRNKAWIECSTHSPSSDLCYVIV